MALPKKRTSTQRQGKRRSGQKKPPNPTLILCKNCKSPKKPHTICPNCGKYKGRAYKKQDEEKERSAPPKKTKDNK